jgi:hypothetical protein
MRLRLLTLLIGCLLLASCSLPFITTKTFNRYIQQGPYDVIIVPGLPYDSGRPSELFKARMYWAKQLYDRGIAKNIIFSGAAVHTPYVESKVMKLYAIAMGIPAAHTFVEIRATHSNENVFYGYRMAHQLGFKKIALATDPFQSFMYSMFSKVYATDLGRLPASMDSIAAYAERCSNIQIDASGAYLKDFTPIERAKTNSLRASFGRLPNFEEEVQ